MKTFFLKGFAFLSMVGALAYAQKNIPQGMFEPHTFEPRMETSPDLQQLKIKPENYLNPEGDALSKSIVQLRENGRMFCSGTFISDKGLILTNHHCAVGTGGVSQQIDEEGFWAKNKKEEIPLDGISAAVTMDYKPVDPKTEKTKEELILEMFPYLNLQANPSAIQEIPGRQFQTFSVGKGLEAEFKPSHAGNKLSLILYRVIPNITLAGIPSSNLGNFGGDTDNWNFPRHTADFSIFRAYEKSENEDLVPFHPEKSLNFSKRGAQEEGPALINGYPGRTQYFQSSSDFLDRANTVAGSYSVSFGKLGNKLTLLLKDSPKEVFDHFSSENASIMNSALYFKYMKGSIDSFGPQILPKIQEDEKALLELVKTNPNFGQYSKILENINQLIVETETIRRNIYSSYPLVYIGVANGPFLLSQMLKDLESLPFGSEKYKETLTEITSEITKLEKFSKVYKEILLTSWEALREVSPELYSKIKESCQQTECDDIRKIIEESIVFDSKKLLKAIEENRENLSNIIFNDPFLKLTNSLSQNLKNTEEEEEKIKALDENRKLLIAAYLQMYKERGLDLEIFPDANATLRYTMGRVEGVNGKSPFTQIGGILDKKDNSNPDFEVDPVFEKAIEKHPKFKNSTACFESTNLITGGNSGSSVLNEYLNIQGVAFDGNISEYGASDHFYLPEFTRTISLDSRFIKFILQHVASNKKIHREVRWKK